MEKNQANKIKTKKQKIIASIITAVIVLGSLFSCNSAGDNNNSSTTTKAASGEVQGETNIEETQETTTIVETKRPEIPEGTNYNEYEFKVLARHCDWAANTDEDEVFAETETGDVLNDAVYKRNRTVEELLNIKITSLPKKSDVYSMASYIKKLLNAGDAEFDAILTAPTQTVILAQQNFLVNLYNVPNLNLANTWWDQQFVKEVTYKNSKLYTINGDINWYDDYSIMALMFNKRMLQENNIDYPYQTVREGKWTFDVFSQLVKSMTKDLNGDGKFGEDDQFGVGDNGSVIRHFLPGLDEAMVSIGADGFPTVNSLTERHLKAVEVLANLFSGNDVLITGRGQLKNDDLVSLFTNGRLFIYGDMLGVVPKFRGMTDDFGILPQPKLDESQANYAHYISPVWATSYAIPSTNTDLARTGMILEAMAGYSVDTITPALIDVSLKSKFARDDETAEMLEIMFSTKKYDWCEMFGWGGVPGAYESVGKNGFGNFISDIEKSVAVTQAAIDKTVVAMDELQ